MLRGGLSGARWISPEYYHVTLRFLGDIDGATARDFAAALDEVRGEPIEVTLESLDAFGGAKPHSVYARIRPSRDLSDLQAEHEKLARLVGLAPEARKFTPHVTLARLRQAQPAAVAGWLGARALLSPIRFAARDFRLYSSRDSVGGGPYLVEARYPLGWAGDDEEAEPAWSQSA